ncbi:Lrp/AsnC family transcriptional regulator [Streptomyces anulatus]|uniref:Lrp/AsnC family transcriptional regulator n=2 Tax=Streptomyces TaxID=1883 RepID=UPI001F52AF61|nr:MULTISPECIES: Lrp/AsnC family transcriptional regulator [Streptomyces]MDF9805150.1 DNA-binding Lrp family transcriptional regulator [Streptomyces sp. HB372]WSC62694.1 Lrp/AsnC family transcriptional regulator [Streptomyces anulatus]WTC64589.1 Lrp/AsnC family transcriptional regulator [Streptomyces anulatus]WUD90224.1 Lrp/AsnC family transcriptional regulator [Streptomyces anulatus]
MAAERMADKGEEQRRATPAATPSAAPSVAPSAAPAGPAAEVPVPPARPLDSIDRDILRILQTDGRASIRSVAERVHVSRANAYARINRLVEDGVIRGFGARVDHERAGQGASAYITLKIVQNSWRTVREQLQALPGATHIALVSGDFDVLLLVHTPDNRALRELVLTRIQSIPEVLSTRTLLVFEETDLGPRPDRPAELA